MNIEPSLHPSNKSHLIMVCDPFYYCWLGLVIFCWGFLYLYSLNLLACNFLFFFSIFVWFWYQGNGSLRMILKVFHPHLYFGKVWEGYLGRIPLWSHLILNFCLLGILLFLFCSFGFDGVFLFVFTNSSH